jgi:hypothetical protein
MAHSLLVYLNGRTGGPMRERLLSAMASLALIFAINSSVVSQSIYQLPAGTRIRLTLDAEINSRVASVDDTFLAVVARPVTNRDAVVLPAGAVVQGRVRGVDHASRGGRGGSLDLVFETLRIGEWSRQIDGRPVTSVRSSPRGRFSRFSVLGGAAAGAAIGGLIGHSGAGAGLGAAAGAGIGMAAAFLKKGDEARLRRGEEFEIELRSPVTLPADDF